MSTIAPDYQPTPTTARLTTLTIAVLDYYHDSRALMPTGVRAMVDTVGQALGENDEQLSTDMLAYFQVVLEEAELLVVPAIAQALAPPVTVIEGIGVADGC